jgi:hypothetical protein
MGLDMYLTKRHYVKNWDHMTDEEKHEIKITKGGEPSKGIDTSKISGIVEDVMYWRKANAIHNWFVRNVQNGEDNCSEYYVNEEQLRELVDDCKSSLEYLNSCKKIKHPVEVGFDGKGPLIQEMEFYDVDEDKIALQTVRGFFFGETKYDDWYKNNLEKTIETLEKSFEDTPEADYYYSSSW